MGLPAGHTLDPSVQRTALHEALHGFYAARQQGDIAGFVSYFAPDARLLILGNPGLNPGAGLRIGRDGIGRHLAFLHERNRYLDHRIDRIVAEGDTVAVKWHATALVLAAGATVSLDILDHMRLRHGQIAEMTHFYDTGTFAAIWGLTARRPGEAGTTTG